MGRKQIRKEKNPRPQGSSLERHSKPRLLYSGRSGRAKISLQYTFTAKEKLKPPHRKKLPRLGTENEKRNWAPQKMTQFCAPTSSIPLVGEGEKRSPEGKDLEKRKDASSMPRRFWCPPVWGEITLLPRGKKIAYRSHRPTIGSNFFSENSQVSVKKKGSSANLRQG